MDFLQLAQNRYSVRKFTERSVEREIIDKILRAGTLAPTAKNLQPQRILVLTSKESLEKLDRATKCRFGAPAAMLVCYDVSFIIIIFGKDDSRKSYCADGRHETIRRCSD